jgi:hypothetical protein
MAQIRLAGPPASTIAWLRSCAVRFVQALADGCALKTTPFPAETMPMALEITLEVGFVLGVIEPITPYGAYSTSVNPSSPVQAVEVRTSGPGDLLALSRFFSILSSSRPMPVSSQAMRASSCAFSRAVRRI